MGAEYCDRCSRMYVCLSVCLSVCEHISKTRRPNFTKFSTHVAYDRSPVPSLPLEALRYAMHISGFVDDVMFAHKLHEVHA